jgi:hypothetical protein
MIYVIDFKLFNLTEKRVFLPNYLLNFLIMKKRDLLLAGLVLLNVSAFAQEEEILEPTRYKDDAKVIFVQDFEDAPTLFTKKVLNPDPKRPTTLYTWNVEPVDSIPQVNYYTEGAGSVDKISDMEGSKFQIAGTRDTLMYLYDGVVRTDAAWPDDSALSFDSHSIVGHDDMSQRGDGLGGQEYGLDRWGEKGGSQYFRYYSATSDGVANRAGSDGDHYVPEYRRNLFIRNIPIEEQSSYRVTVFVKPTLTAKTQTSIKPRLGLDLMRGYFHSEKSFMVNPYKKEAKNSWGGDEFATFNDKTSYTDLENGKWNKITLMAYYNNDEIGNASAYMLSYYWDSDWNWDVKVDADGKVAEEGTAKTLKYIQQPDKYFVRLSFRSDSTIFDVDNLSLTKSWIGGVEYSGKMARVDFGYQTNLGDLAEAAKEENKIASVELPGKYFDVWGLYDDDKEDPDNELIWEYVPILSAEYQGDGFMYMWTEPWDNGDPRLFDDYDSVLVSFKNPTDSAALMLKYTGASYPNGADSAWNADKENRIVFDFHNEIGYLNPTIDVSPVTKQPVRSLAELTPVLQKYPYEDGAFGLDPKTRELTFKFSKNLSFDNLRDKAKKSQVVVIQGGTQEYWTIKDYEGDANTGWTTIVRPDDYIDDLAGDYQILFHKCTHLNKPTLDTDYSEDYTVNYHFGEFATDASYAVVAKSDWRSEITETGKWARPVPPSLAYNNEVEDGFLIGTGVNQYNPNKPSDYTKLGLYQMNDNAKGYGDCLFYLAGRGSGKTGSVYTSEHLNKGTYKLSFPAFGWATTSSKTHIYVYANPVKDWDELTLDTIKKAKANQVEIGLCQPKNQTSWSNNDPADYDAKYLEWIDGTAVFEYTFTVPAEGDYIIEWAVEGKSTNYQGVALGNYTIFTSGGLSFGPVADVNGSIASAAAKLLAADAAKYRGAAYSALETVKDDASHFVADKKATFENLPSEYAAEKKLIDAAVEALKLQMDTVDAFYKAIDDANAKLAVYADSLAKYQEFAAVDALQKTVNGYDGYVCSAQAPGQIAADTKILKDAIAAVDARQALVDKLDKAVADAEAALTTFAHLKAYSVYSDVEDVLVTAAGISRVSAEDAEIVSMTNEVDAKRLALANRDNLAKVATKRIKALDQLAKNLNAAYGDNADKAAEIANRISSVDFDDDELANIQKAAITAALYEKIANATEEPVDSIDLTPFIKNYHLYATINGPIVDNTAKQLPGSRYDAECKAENNPGSSIMHIKHEWGQDALGKTIWVLMYEKEFDDVFPGWTVQSFITSSGHSMVTPDDATDKYSNLSKGTTVFDGKLTMDWNSKAELKTTVADLPAGVYALNVAVASNKSGDSKLTVTADGKDYVKSMPKDNKDAKIDSIAVSAGQMDIDFVLASTDGGSQADDFSLMFLGKDPSFNYAMAAESAKEALNNLITVVDFAEVEGAEYEYYTLNWIKVETLEKGQVYFRKLGNVVEKVIFK